MNHLPFNEALEDCSRLAGKVPQALCLDKGDFPVIGQGKQEVDGFTNDSGLIFRGDLPVILFGDHTAAFKFVDRPFARGADGTKLFRPRTQLLDAKFAWHFLQTAKLPDTGYDRKTKYLENLNIPLPPLEEQRRIAAILDKASQILIASRKADALRQHLLERLFTSMFGDPRENPFGWPKLAIEELTSDYVGGAALAPEDFEDEGVPVLHKGAIKPGGEIEADSRKKGFVSHQTAQNYKRCLAGPGKIAVTLRDLVPSGPFIGLMAELSTTGAPEYLLAQGAYAFKVDARRLLPDYLIALVNMPTFRLVLRQNAVGSTQIHIRLPIFKSIKIPVPPIESQLEFAQVIDRISSLNTLSRRQVRHVDELTRSLHGSSFCGLDA
jgi:type I restriction enzyme S subunit